MPAKVDWYYHRKNCQTCSKSQAFLSEYSVEIGETVDARKTRFDGAAAIEFVRQADEVWIARGKHVRRINFKKESLAGDELLKLILGPSGNLRAPTIRCGKKLFIGFEPSEYGVFLRI